MTATVYPDSAISDIKTARASGRPVWQREIPQHSSDDCPNCGGAGLLWLEFKLGGPFMTPSTIRTTSAYVGSAWITVETKTYPCPLCTDHTALIRSLFERSGLEQGERDWRVDYIDNMVGKEVALCAARGILERTPRIDGWYLFYGDYSKGKTGVLKSVVAQSVLAGVNAHYCRAVDILDAIKTTYNDGSNGETESAVKARYANMKLLAVDEVDRISGTDWANATLMSVLDTRYSRRSSCCTLFATNSKPNEMPVGFEYLASRFLDGMRIPITGKDLRGNGQIPSV